MNSNDIVGCVIWLLLIVMIALAVVIYAPGCCASKCETMLVECERGLDDLTELARCYEDDDSGVSYDHR